MLKGGRTSTTWAAGQNPVKKKGQKHKKTKLKESIGLQSWEGLKNFVENEGATKLINEMKQLKGKDFVMAMDAIAEYIKPKLSRTEVDAGKGTTIKISIKKSGNAPL